MDVCLGEGSSLSLLVSIEFKPVCTLIFPVVVSTERCGTPHLSLAQAWILILYRLSFLYLDCCPASLPTGRWGLFSSSKASLVAQMVKNLPAMRETWLQSLGQEDPLQKEMATHSSFLAWEIPWTQEPGRLQSVGLQRVRHD